MIVTADILSAHKALASGVRDAEQRYRHRLRALHSPPSHLLDIPLLPSPTSSPLPSPRFAPVIALQPKRPELPPSKRARIVKYHNYVPEEETIRNDYSQRYVDGGEWPQNWVMGAETDRRFEEYPKQQRLLNLKKTSVTNHCMPSSYLPFSFMRSLPPCKFDVILIDPPFSSSFTWDVLQDLPIPTLAADPSFVFLWVGSGVAEGLERGREVLAKWGYRRCEDVVWVKTNKATNLGPGTDPPTTSLLTRTKQHCLIGIRGTVRRSTDSWFVHCNIDTDVIIWEGDPSDPTRKPPEMYTLIENFCLGIRRLEIFGKITSLRRGWVTVLADGQGPQVNECSTAHVDGGVAHWNKENWENGIKELANGGKCIVPVTSDIDALRPKSPFRLNTLGTSSSGGSSGPTMIGAGGARAGHFGEVGQALFRNGGAPHQGSQRQNGVGPPPMELGLNVLGNVCLPTDGIVPGLAGWPALMTPGMGMMGIGHQVPTTEQIGMSSFHGVPMAWPGISPEMQNQHQFMDNQGVWDGVDELVGLGMVGLNSMTNMGSLGMGMDQWGAQYNGYH